MSPQEQTYPLSIHPRELTAILRRRWRWLIPPIVLGVLGASAAVVMRKPVYQSSATLLIDSPQIPATLIASPLVDAADERIAKIRQQIVGRESLNSLIRANNLYIKERGKLEQTTVLDLMRNSIGVDLVGAEQGQRGAGSSIAFTLSFKYRDPVKARDVTDQLTKMFLVEDKRFRTEQAHGTAVFLDERAGELRQQLAQLEDKRRGIESRYAGALPDNVAQSVQASTALRAQIAQTDTETQGLIQANGSLSARQQELEQAPPPGTEALRAAETRLAQLLATHSDSFPDVIAARAEIDRQHALLNQRPVVNGAAMVANEIAAGRERIRTLGERRAEMVRSAAELDRRAAETPQAAFELNMVEREYDNLKRQYDSLREKQLDAQVSANLQSEDKGERFTVVDPPSLPTKPLGAKPAYLLLFGLIGGTGLGICLILAYEWIGGTIHGEATLTHTLGVPSFGVVPIAGRDRPLARLEQIIRNWLPARLRPAGWATRGGSR